MKIYNEEVNNLREQNERIVAQVEKKKARYEALRKEVRTLEDTYLEVVSLNLTVQSKTAGGLKQAFFSPFLPLALCFLLSLLLAIFYKQEGEQKP